MNANPEGGTAKPLPAASRPIPKEEVIQELRPYLKEGSEEAAAVRVEALLVRTTYHGPFPPSVELASYERTLPGATERIFAMMEREQQHRHNTDLMLLREESELKKRGQLGALLAHIGAFLALVVSLFVVVQFLNRGEAAWGATFGGAVIVGVVAAFLRLKGEQQSDDRPHGPPKT